MASSEKNILIVEDNRDQAQALAMHAKGKGYLPKIAYDTIIALMMLQQSKIDLVILDLGLPGGGGLSMLENMKKSFKTQDIPVVVLTAKIEAGLEEKAREKGVSEYFVKPCPMEKLFGAIDAILRPPAKK
jgi:DNA-binding response OmpR family regulator